MGMVTYTMCHFRSQDSIIICFISMNERIELIFYMLIHGVRKAKSYFGYAHGQIWLWPFRSWESKICLHMVKYGCDLLGSGNLKSALSQLKNKLMNWVDFCMLEVMEQFFVRPWIMLSIFGFEILRLRCICVAL